MNLNPYKTKRSSKFLYLLIEKKVHIFWLFYLMKKEECILRLNYDSITPV